jgi:AraC-like DNA-binding protein
VSLSPSLIRRLTQARDRIADDFDTAPGLRELARIAGLSPHHMLRAFRRRFGETPHDLLTRRRLEAAKAALRAGRSVTEACFDVGYSSLGSFSASFRRRVGVSPSHYQRALRVAVPSAELAHAVAIPFCFAQAFAPRASAIAISEKPLPFRP